MNKEIIRFLYYIITKIPSVIVYSLIFFVLYTYNRGKILSSIGLFLLVMLCCICVYIHGKLVDSFEKWEKRHEYDKNEKSGI